jgi:guanylate kinase
MHLIIISSPSGGGKSTICKKLMNEQSSPLFGNVEFSISVTTRPKRSHETNGKEYHFVSQTQFQEMVKAGEFLEWAEVFGNLYGTLKKNISQTKHTLFDIDHQGHSQINTSKLPSILSIFLLPPSIETLKQRLETRGDISPEVISRRITGANLEIASANHYDFIIVNQDIQKTFEMCVAAINETIFQKKTQISQNVLAITNKIKNVNNKDIDLYLKEALRVSKI